MITAPTATRSDVVATLATLFRTEGVNRKTLRRARSIFTEAFGIGANVVDMSGVPAKDGRKADHPAYTVRTLLSPADSNKKLSLSDDASDQFVTFGVSMAPSKENGLSTVGGHRINLCSHASAGCRAICLMDTGYARVSPNVRLARIAKSRLFVTRPDVFKAMLLIEAAAASLAASRIGKTLLVRLNVFSDVVWERKFPELFAALPSVRFYDYTKIPTRMGRTPANYHLTFSRSEDNHDVAVGMLAMGYNVAVVFEDHTFPATFHGFRTIDGTLTDLRVTDPHNVVVALAEKDTELHGPRYKGKRNLALNTSGFVLPTATSNVHSQPMPLA